MALNQTKPNQQIYPFHQNSCCTLAKSLLSIIARTKKLVNTHPQAPTKPNTNTGTLIIYTRETWEHPLAEPYQSGES